MKNKYFTDKTNLCLFLSENEKEVKVRIVETKDTHNRDKILGKEFSFKKETFYEKATPYDLDNPIMEKHNAGKCYCESCGKELKVGDECYKYDYEVFCSIGCIEDYIALTPETITEEDLDDSKVIEKPMFDYKEPKPNNDTKKEPIKIKCIHQRVYHGDIEKYLICIHYFNLFGKMKKCDPSNCKDMEENK